MKTIINKILHGLSLGIISIMLALGVLLVLLRLADPYLATRHHDVEQFVSKLVQQPVSMKRITIANRGLEPVLKLTDVTVFNDAKTKTLLYVRELQVGIDLIGSFLTRSIKPGLLVVDGINFSVHQDRNGKIHIVGVKGDFGGAANPDFAVDEILEWLFEQSKIYLSDVALTYRLADGAMLQFTNLDLQLDNGVLQHNLKINGRLVQKPLPVRFNVNLKLRGRVLKQEVFTLAGDVVVEDSILKLPQKFFTKHAFNLPQSGDINLLTKRTQVTTGLLRQPILFDVLDGRLMWKYNKDGLSVNINKFNCKDKWLSVNGNMQLLFPPEMILPIVDIQLRFKLLNLAKARLYYPVTELPPKATVWLDQAFVNSKPMTGTMLLNGPLAKFPFDHNEGRFLVDAEIRDVYLNYNPEWLPVENINGRMIFSNRSMVITTRKANIMRVLVESIKATIPDLDLPILNINSTMRTDSSLGLKFVNSSPLKETIAQKLQTTKLYGPMRLVLNMDIPLTDLVAQKSAKVDGQVVLYENYLQPYALGFGISDLEGKLHFTEDDLIAENITGKLFGRTVQLMINTLHKRNNDTVTQITMAGSAATKDVGRDFGINFSPYVIGDFKYQALLRLHNLAQESVFKIHSDLQGVAVDLPEPFVKAVNTKGNFDLVSYFGGKRIPRINVNYNNQIRAALAIKKLETGSWRLLAGELRFGATQPEIPATPGVIVTGSLQKLSWPVWRDYLTKAGNGLNNISTAIRQVNLKVGTLYAFGRAFKQALLQAKPQNDGWEIKLVMATIKGQLFFPKNEQSHIRGVFDKLDLRQEMQGITTLKPQDLLPLKFVISDLYYDKQIFHNVDFITERKVGGININRLTINDPKFKLDANGDWLAVGDKQESVLRGKISSSDTGSLLKKLDLTDNLVAGKGEASFVLKWPGAPYDPSLKSIGGTFVIHAQNGSIINLNKKTERQLGISKILNMLSLRHLTLDFKDLTKQGFIFDKLDGNFELANGNALAKNITLDGPVALIKARGRIGMVAKDYDIILSTIPHITSSVPVVAAITTANPVIGLLSWLVTDKLIAPGIKKVITYNYHITGSWDKPIVQKIK